MKIECPGCGFEKVYPRCEGVTWCGRCGTSIYKNGFTTPVLLDCVKNLGTHYKSDERVYSLLRCFGLLDVIKEEVKTD